MPTKQVPSKLHILFGWVYQGSWSPRLPWAQYFSLLSHVDGLEWSDTRWTQFSVYLDSEDSGHFAIPPCSAVQWTCAMLSKEQAQIQAVYSDSFSYLSEGAEQSGSGTVPCPQICQAGNQCHFYSLVWPSLESNPQPTSLKVATELVTWAKILLTSTAGFSECIIRGQRVPLHHPSLDLKLLRSLTATAFFTEVDGNWHTIYLFFFARF